MERLYLEIATPERLMVAKEVDMVEAPGASGEFGVLPGHVAFFTALDYGEIRYMVDGATRFVSTSGGFAEVLENRMTILADTAEFEEEIDLERARRAKERAEAALKALSVDQAEYRAFQAALMRAITRISTGARAGQ